MFCHNKLGCLAHSVYCLKFERLNFPTCMNWICSHISAHYCIQEIWQLHSHANICWSSLYCSQPLRKLSYYEDKWLVVFGILMHNGIVYLS